MSTPLQPWTAPRVTQEPTTGFGDNSRNVRLPIGRAATTSEAPMDNHPAARRLWAQTKLRVDEEPYRLVSLATSDCARAAEILASVEGGFAALILEPFEVSLSLPESLWQEHRGRFPMAREDGPFRAITLNLDVELSTWGYFAPAAAR